MRLSKKVLKMIKREAKNHVNIALQVTSYLPLSKEENNHVNHQIRQDSENLIRLVAYSMTFDVLNVLESQIQRGEVLAQSVPRNDGVNLKKKS